MGLEKKILSQFVLFVERSLVAFFHFLSISRDHDSFESTTYPASSLDLADLLQVLAKKKQVLGHAQPCMSVCQ